MSFGKSQPTKRLPTSEDVLKYVSDAEIFSAYLGGLPKRPISSPLREDVKPSFSLFHSDVHNILMYKDFGTGEVGDCFVFVKRLFRLGTKIEAINKVAQDFNLTEFRLDGSTYSIPAGVKFTKKKVEFCKKEKVRISIKVRKWSVNDRAYWEGKYGLNIKQLEYCGVYPISHYFINGNCIKGMNLSYAFVENKDGNQTFKIYQPEGDKDTKWINNNDYSTWELWSQLPETGDTLIIASSRKDAMVIKSLFPSNKLTSCALQSEGVNPKENVTDELKDRFKRIFVLYDNDYNSETNWGRVNGQKLCEQTGFKQIEIPEVYQAKDPSDFIDKYDKSKTKRLILDLILNK